MKPFEELAQSSTKAHGHLCPGQVVGVRMTVRILSTEESRDLAPFYAMGVSGHSEPQPSPGRADGCYRFGLFGRPGSAS